MAIAWETLLAVGAISFLAYWLGLLNRQHNGLVNALDERFQTIAAALWELDGHYATREDLDHRSATFHHLITQLDNMDTSGVEALSELESNLRVLKRGLRQRHS